MSSGERKESKNRVSNATRTAFTYGNEVITALHICSDELTKVKEELQLAHKSVACLADPNHVAGICPTYKAPDEDDTDQSLFDLRYEVMQLKAELSDKNEKIKSLAAILMSIKNATENLIGGIGRKYEISKAVTNETILKLATLTNFLKKLKELSTPISLSHHAAFAARLEENANRENKLKQQLAVAEKDRKHLDRLLRLAVQQTVCLTMKHEELSKARDDVRLSVITKPSDQTVENNQRDESVGDLKDVTRNVIEYNEKVQKEPVNLITEEPDDSLNESDNLRKSIEKLEKQMQQMQLSGAYLEYLANKEDVAKIIENETVKDH
ncbi:uncharacterized protein LOC131666725 [Phymastichus coffea]|uniref:uncharacterized protein LOC131666725 n=1 Tax=Phymastichus coffea TaxID=108790 RepID=UPI00273C0F39|nr:uncharacterized protein LOC131666725 [Phymastichus coffea]